MTFDENSPNMIDSSEDENCNKKLIQNDAGSSQDKLYDKYKIHSLDECAENMVKKLRVIQKHANNDIGKKIAGHPTQKRKFYLRNIQYKNKTK